MEVGKSNMYQDLVLSRQKENIKKLITLIVITHSYPRLVSMNKPNTCKNLCCKKGFRE